ncbi:MAG: dethiobiotin synthase [Puniceicoccales bacterium]|nr:dethiobiotin synthase [Puniceicoccales bacterium]
MNIFVTGTDTDVGKTTVAAWICQQVKVAYWKPIQTGNVRDSETVKILSPHTKIIDEAYRFSAPLSPYDAAKIDNISIDEKLLKRRINSTVIEGAGGILVPIKVGFCMADLVKLYNAKTIVVARSKLGVINHILMTMEVLKTRNIDILGIIINGQMETNIGQTIELFSGSKILAHIPHGNDLNGMLRSIRIPSEISEVFR